MTCKTALIDEAAAAGGQSSRRLRSGSTSPTPHRRGGAKKLAAASSSARGLAGAAQLIADAAAPKVAGAGVVDKYGTNPLADLSVGGDSEEAMGDEEAWSRPSEATSREGNGGAAGAQGGSRPWRVSRSPQVEEAAREAEREKGRTRRARRAPPGD